jgi:hypothetical protein
MYLLAVASCPPGRTLLSGDNLTAPELCITFSRTLKIANRLLVRSVDSLHDFRSRFGARLNHPSGYHRPEVADQPSKQAIRHQRLFFAG